MGIHYCSVNKGRIYLPKEIITKFGIFPYRITQKTQEDENYNYLLVEPGSSYRQGFYPNDSNRFLIGKKNLEFILVKPNSEVVVMGLADSFEIYNPQTYKTHFFPS